MKARKILTKGQLDKYSRKVDDLVNIIDMCDPDRDGDVLDAIDAELGDIIAILEVSHKNAKIAESGLVLIQGGKL